MVDEHIFLELKQEIEYYALKDRWQYDKGVTLDIKLAEQCYNVRVCFCYENETNPEANIILVPDENNVVSFMIPDIMFFKQTKKKYRFYVYIYYENGETGITLNKIECEVKPRVIPFPDIAPEEVPKVFDEIVKEIIEYYNKVKELTDEVNIQKVVDDYFEEHNIYQLIAEKYTKPDTGIPEDDLSEEVREKLNSGGQGSVWAVNGYTGEVWLNAEDVGAYDKNGVDELIRALNQYVVQELSLIDEELTNKASKQYVDEILEEVNKKANIEDIPTKLSDLTEDTTHRTVTDAEKQTWNDKVDIDELEETEQTLNNSIEEIKQDVENKVDKVDGKGLSTNDYTNEDKKNVDDVPEIKKSVGSLKEDLDTKITAPENPVVGKILAVKEVLEDGKMVVELVDAPSGGVSDVTVGGKSVVQDGVAVIKYPTTYDAGVVKIDGYYGLSIGTAGNLGKIIPFFADSKSINARSERRFIQPSNIDYAVKAAMCDGKGSAWTEEEQTAAQERIGILSSEGVLF